MLAKGLPRLNKTPNQNQISMFGNYSFSFEQMITKRSRIMKRRGECNLVKP